MTIGYFSDVPKDLAESPTPAVPSVMPIAPPVQKGQEPEPTFGEQVGATFERNNPIASVVAFREDLEGVDMTPDPDFNWVEEIVDTKYEPYADAFFRADNRSQFEGIKLNLDREMKNQRIEESSGWAPWLIGMAGAVIADPTNLLPAGQAVRSARVGFSAVKSAGSVGVATGAAVAASEGVLQASQNIRPVEETAAAIGGSVLLGGLLGAGAAKLLSRAEMKSLGDKLAKELKEPGPTAAELNEAVMDAAREPVSGGAAATPKLSMDDLEIYGKVAGAVAKLSSNKLFPGIQTMRSPSVETRRVYNDLIENTLLNKAQAEGRGPVRSAETNVKFWQRGAQARFLQVEKQMYKKAKAEGYNRGRDSFVREASYAARRGDESENLYVQKVAQSWREMVAEPLLKRSELPDDITVQTAQTYLTRMWNPRIMFAEEPKVKGVFQKYFRGAIEEEFRRVEKMDSLGKPLGPNDIRRDDFLSKEDIDDYLQEAVNRTFDNIVGRGDEGVRSLEATPAWMVPLTRGPLKERTFKIPDALVEEFLENDIRAVVANYVRTMGAEVELQAKFGRADMADQFADITKDYDKLRKEASGIKDPKKRLKEVKRLRKAEERDTTNLAAFRDQVRGTYRVPEQHTAIGKATRAALTWNYIRLLGGVTLSSASDAMRVATSHGIGNLLSDVIAPMATKTGRLARKISKQEAREMGAVVETYLNSRLATLAELDNPHAAGSPFERLMANASTMFSKGTGLPLWNDVMKSSVSTMTQNRILRNITSGMDNLSAAEKRFMAKVGIDTGDAQAIAANYAKHGRKEGPTYIAGIQEWDEAARMSLAGALNKISDQVVVTRGIGDMPLFMHSNTGKLIMQFKSFALASHQRVLLAGLQDEHSKLLSFVVGGTALGMMVSWLKMVERGDYERAESLIENLGRWVADGLDRTGIFSVPFDTLNTVDKAASSGGAPAFGTGAIGGLIAQDDDKSGGSTRYVSRNPLGAVMGPSAGILQDWSTILGQLAAGDMKKSGANAIIRQVPGATLPFTRAPIHHWAKPVLQDAVK